MVQVPSTVTPFTFCPINSESRWEIEIYVVYLILIIRKLKPINISIFYFWCRNSHALCKSET